MNDPIPVDSGGVISFRNVNASPNVDSPEAASSDRARGETSGMAEGTTLRRHDEQIQNMDSMISTMSGVLKDVVTVFQSTQLAAHHHTPGETRTDAADANDNYPRSQVGYNMSSTTPPSSRDYWPQATGHEGTAGGRYYAYRDRDEQGPTMDQHTSHYSQPASRTHRTDRPADGYHTANRTRYPARSGDDRVAKHANVKIPSFDGKVDWSMWIARFEAIAYRYKWTAEDKLDQLLPRIEGAAAQFVFSQLPPAVLGNYHELVAEINSRFRVVETACSFAAKFSRRNQRHGETAEDYAADLKRLYDKGHGYRDRQTRDEDLVRRFLDGLLDEDVRFEVEFHKEPQNIDEAVYQVVNLLQIRHSCRGEKRSRNMVRRTQEPAEEGDMYHDDGDEQERAYAVNDRPASRALQDHPRERVWRPRGKEPDPNEKLMEIVLARLDKLENRRKPTSKQNSECYNCHRLGHFARECPDRPNGNRNRGETDQIGAQQQEAGRHLNYDGPALAAKGGSN